jgi:hypothetical protein
MRTSTGRGRIECTRGGLLRWTGPSCPIEAEATPESVQRREHLHDVWGMIGGWIFSSTNIFTYYDRILVKETHFFEKLREYQLG